MRFINTETLASIDTNAFENAKPFPYANPHGFLTDEGYDLLVKTLPSIDHLHKDFGRARKYGQMPHDRYRLSYSKDLTFLDQAWHDFVAELYSPVYQDFIKRVFGVSKFDFRLEWHYAEKGGKVTPHLDGPTNYGAQLFYAMSEREWKHEWGGQTLILGSKTPLPIDANPSMDDFDEIIEAKCIGNNSLIFKNTSNAWHGVRDFSPPAGTYRKIFTLFITKPKPWKQKVKESIARLFGKKAQ